MAEERSIEALIADLHSSDLNIRDGAMSALVEIGTAEAQAAVEAWRRERDKA